ncbi:MAG: hypothetical protein KA173_13470, partial [Rhodoferax sp.]|nr:hypothetical protein [Rhodoferax sp.]
LGTKSGDAGRGQRGLRRNVVGEDAQGGLLFLSAKKCDKAYRQESSLRAETHGYIQLSKCGWVLCALHPATVRAAKTASAAALARFRRSIYSWNKHQF